THAGYTLNDVVKASIFISNMDDFASINEVYAQYFTENQPARECVAVKPLPKHVNGEISVIAWKPDCLEESPQKTESRRNYFLAAFLAPLIWGFMAIPVRWVKEYPAEDILYYRILIALIVLWLFIFLFRSEFLKRDIAVFKQLPRYRQNQTIGLTVLASVLIFGNWFTYIYAVNHISVQSAAF